MKHLSYFNSDGSYRGTFNTLEPTDVPGSRLHADGMTLIRADGGVIRQDNPYLKARHAAKGLIEVEGELSGEWRLVNGTPQKVGLPPPPPAPISAEELFDMLRAKGVVSDADRPRAKA